MPVSIRLFERTTHFQALHYTVWTLKIAMWTLLQPYGAQPINNT